MTKKILFDKNDIENLEKELEQLRKYLNYKNAGYCKRFLNDIIQKYFKKEKEVKRQWEKKEMNQ